MKLQLASYLSAKHNSKKSINICCMSNKNVKVPIKQNHRIKGLEEALGSNLSQILSSSENRTDSR